MARPVYAFQPKFSHVTVKLLGEDGNCFSILGRTTLALKRAGASRDEVAQYMSEATSGDYRHLLVVTARWVEVR
jgi:hypothetical protein